MKKTSKDLYMTPAEFRAWETRHGFTLATTSRALGMSPRQIANYRREGAPRSIAMACFAWDHGWSDLGETWLGVLCILQRRRPRQKMMTGTSAAAHR